jgi:hypothetical protein
MSDRHFVHHEDEVQLAKILRDSKPWLEKYGTTVIYGLAAVMAVAAVGVYIARRPPATAPESREMLLASTPEDYQAIADATPDSKIGIIARVRQAELLLGNAVEKLFSDREKAVEELAAATTAFERLAERKDVTGYQRERVLAGLARAAESQCDGTDESVQAAIQAWELLLKEFPDSKLFKDLAEERVKKLSDESTKSFYAWFHSQNPKPADDLQIPQDGPGAVPDIPRISIPDLTSPMPTVPSAPVDAKEGDAKEEASDTSAPAADTPATETPAAEPKAEEKPADIASGDAKTADPAPADPAATPEALKDAPADPEPAAESPEKPEAPQDAPPADPPAAEAPASPEKSGE